MTQRSPYDALSTARQRLLCVVFIALTLVYGQLLKRQGEPLMAALPHGIVSLELPGTPAVAQQMITSLGALAPVARRQVQLDFGYLLLYPVAFSLVCALLAERNGPGLARFGRLMSWAVLLAAPLDAIENVALLQMLDGQTQAPWPQLSTVCATLKFSLLIAAAGRTVLGLLGMVLARRRRG